MNYIDRHSPVPLYHQFKEYLIERIESGDYPVGQTIPAEMELVSKFGVSRATVRRAMQELEQDGYINRAAGRGTFVLRTKLSRGLSHLTSFTEEMHARGQKVTTRILNYSHITPPPHVAEMLQADADTPLLYIHRLRFADQIPIAISVSYLKLPDGVAISEEELNQSQSLWTLLERKGIPLLEADKTIVAASANEERAGLLGIHPGTSLLVVEGVAYTYNHLAVEYHQVISGGERYQYSLHLTR